MKKFVLAVMMCCTFSAASNAIWLPAFFLRFVSSVDSCEVACHTCTLDGNLFACMLAKEYCTCDECPPVCQPPDVN
ncbi:hypothetical protein [Candidatus Endomicrobiellum devescovinae]|uniref:hypothetical protein n=1 Tax=Candidatus Endomicrobiellum devescovinae TaxID=3242322 RepID=UPI0028180E36|nr:hypothetical protein [Endomicrobium sp.]